MSSETWKLEKDLCRCCHSEGDFKNLAEPYSTEGKSKIIADILKECLEIDLTPVPGLLCMATYTICDACSIRLRDAVDFKKQVLDCEERFQDMYNRNCFSALTYAVNVDVKEELSGVEDDKIELPRIELPIEYCDSNSSDVQINDDGDEDYIAEPDVGKKRKCKSRKSMKSKQCKKAKRKTETEAVDEDDEEKKQDYATLTAPYYTIKEHEGSKLFACTSCSRTYKTLPSVVQHYRHVHLRLRPKLRSCFFCEIKVPGHVRAFHLEKEHGIPAPTCNACGKKFAYPFQVLRHQKNFHMGEKKFGCSECEMRFTSQANLAQHMIKHSGVRVHRCEICEKSFKWKKNLRTHIMMHMDERRHVCHVCQDAFVQQTSLKYHITKVHPECV